MAPSRSPVCCNVTAWANRARASRAAFAALEAETGRELHDTPAVLVVLRQAAEIAVGIVPLAVVEAQGQVPAHVREPERVVEEVIGGEPELKPAPSSHLEVLEQREVVVEVR